MSFLKPGVIVRLTAMPKMSRLTAWTKGVSSH